MNIKDLIEPLICLSTLHLTKGTCDNLDTYPLAYPNEYGAFVHVGVGDIDHEDDQRPADLVKVLNWARDLGMIWVKFDGDGHVFDDQLPTYNSTWE